MPGGRKTHDFPSGTPIPVVMLWVAWPTLFFVWFVFGGGFSQGWQHWLDNDAVAKQLFDQLEELAGVHYEF
jgi:hypothetical protein